MEVKLFLISKSDALRQIGTLRRYDAVAILDAIERHLKEEPERPSRSVIKRLRRCQDTVFRLRVGEYRVFYDVAENRVEIVQILHRSETKSFYKEEMR